MDYDTRMTRRDWFEAYQQYTRQKARAKKPIVMARFYADMMAKNPDLRWNKYSMYKYFRLFARQDRQLAALSGVRGDASEIVDIGSGDGEITAVVSRQRRVPSAAAPQAPVVVPDRIEAGVNAEAPAPDAALEAQCCGIDFRIRGKEAAELFLGIVAELKSRGGV